MSLVVREVVVVVGCENQTKPSNVGTFKRFQNLPSQVSKVASTKKKEKVFSLLTKWSRLVFVLSKVICVSCLMKVLGIILRFDCLFCRYEQTNKQMGSPSYIYICEFFDCLAFEQWNIANCLKGCFKSFSF